MRRSLLKLCFSFVVLSTSSFVYAQADWDINGTVKIDEDFYRVYMHVDANGHSSSITIHNLNPLRSVNRVQFGTNEVESVNQVTFSNVEGPIESFTLGGVLLTRENIQDYICETPTLPFDLERFSLSELIGMRIMAYRKNPHLTKSIEEEIRRKRAQLFGSVTEPSSYF